MALPVVNINIDYESEKGMMRSLSNKHISLSLSIEKIGEFLSKHVSEDISRGLAGLDLDDGEVNTRTRGLKYMEQLVSFQNQLTRQITLTRGPSNA